MSDDDPDDDDPDDDGRFRTDTQRVQDGRFNTKRRVNSVEIRAFDALGEAVKVREGGVGVVRVLAVRVL